MKYGTFLHSITGLVGSTVGRGAAQAKPISLSQDWLFHEGDLAGAQDPTLDDRYWRRVIVPHDFSIEDGPDGKPPFDPQTAGGADSGYIPGGIGWYRRHLHFRADVAKKVIVLKFEAVYMDADVWLNGKHLVKHHYGYTAFQVDITGKVHPGDNLIAVRVNHEDSSSRWYAGSGIIRPVSLDILPLVHIASDGPTILTPNAVPECAEVRVVTPLVNNSPRAAAVTLASRILDRRGRTVASAKTRQSLSAGEQFVVEQVIPVHHPLMWSIESPHLYRLSQSLQAGSRHNIRTTTFGIRTIRFDAEHGFRLNDQRVVLRGGNIHHDNYMLGGAGFPRAEARKLEWMKAAGYNAVRSAHNPLSQASLDAADRLGLLVIDEAFDAWTEPKRPKDYARFFVQNWREDLRSLVVSGRNHPSVIMWSIGNEILEQIKPEGAKTTAMLVKWVHALDPSRPVTQAVNLHTPETNAVFSQLDIAGYNYLPMLYGPDHAIFPKRLMMATESYPDKVFDYWEPTKTMPWVLGDFVWTAVDYLGEASIGGTGYSKDFQQLGPYPWQLAWCGEIDAIGRARPNAYYRRMVWGNSPQPIAAFVHWPDPEGSLPGYGTGGHPEWVMQDLHPNWTWPGYEGQPLDVVVFSELPEVELFLNGRSLGRKTLGAGDQYKTSFAVLYEPGALKAVGYRGDKPVSEWTLQTTGVPAAVEVSADRMRIAADGTDLSYVTAKLVDTEGRIVYTRADDRRLEFCVDGAGVLVGVGNGNPCGIESFQSGKRSTFHGYAVAAVRAGTAPGSVVVRVTAEGLPPQQLTIRVQRSLSDRK